MPVARGAQVAVPRGRQVPVGPVGMTVGVLGMSVGGVGVPVPVPVGGVHLLGVGVDVPVAHVGPFHPLHGVNLYHSEIINVLQSILQCVLQSTPSPLSQGISRDVPRLGAFLFFSGKWPNNFLDGSHSELIKVFSP